MSKSKRAVAEVSAFLKGFRNFLELEKQLEEAGSIENLIAARQRDLAALEAKVAGISGQLAEADAQAAQHLADARDRAESLINAANVKAAEAQAVQRAAEAAAASARADADRIVGETEQTKTSAE